MLAAITETIAARNGQVVAIPKNKNLMDLAGIFKLPPGVTLSLEDMEDAVADAFAQAWDAGRPQVVWTRLIDDLETPVSAYLKVGRGHPFAFLFESVEGGENVSRFSFIGCNPRKIISAQAGDADPLKLLDWYGDFVGIVVQPGAVVARRKTTDGAGVVHHYNEVLAGEAMDRGPLMLSW